MAKELVNLQKNNTKSFISIFLIIMKIFTKLVSVFLLVAIGSLFFFSCAEKEKCTPMVSNKNIMNMKSLFYLVVTMVVIIACTNEEFDANSEVKKEEVKTKIASLAEKYDVNIDFFEINPSEKTENEMSLEEIEELFRDIKQLREHPVELKMYKDKEENGCMFYSTKEQKPSVPLAKTRSEIYSFSDWIWNLTWFSVTLIEDNKNVTVMTDITGLSVYTYSQSYASGYVSGNSISFNSTGKIKATITQVVGFNLSYVINSSGTYDKSAGKGSVTVSAY